MSAANATTALKRILKFNAIFSALTGVILIIDAPMLVEFMATGTTMLYIAIGAGLLAFAFILWNMSRAQELAIAQVWTVFYLDVAWVVGSIALLLSPVALSVGGYWLVAILADIVAIFAGFEWFYLRKLRQTDAAAVGV